jgi:hypothetical protein
MLARSLAGVMGTIRVIDRPLPPAALSAQGPADSTWLSTTLGILDDVARLDSAWACVTQPATRARGTPAQGTIATILLNSDLARAGRLALGEGDGWTVRVAPNGCPPADTTRT